MARQDEVEANAGRYRGARDGAGSGRASPARGGRPGGGRATGRAVAVGAGFPAPGEDSRARKPTLDEMGPHARELPVGGPAPSRPAPRSTAGVSGAKGKWKGRRG